MWAVKAEASSQMITVLLGAFFLKAVVALFLWADKLSNVCYEASVHVRALEGKPFTPGESAAQRVAMKVSARFAMAVPIIGCLGVMGWPNVALPRSGKFEGAESFREQVRQICFHAFLPDLAIFLSAILYFLYHALAK